MNVHNCDYARSLTFWKLITRNAAAFVDGSIKPTTADLATYRERSRKTERKREKKRERVRVSRIEMERKNKSVILIWEEEWISTANSSINQYWEKENKLVLLKKG